MDPETKADQLPSHDDERVDGRRMQISEADASFFWDRCIVQLVWKVLNVQFLEWKLLGFVNFEASLYPS
jgi:hypothetical protein